MKTLLTSSYKHAAEFIKRSCVVAFPTETVYGLGANAFDEKAVRLIYRIKKRPSDNPLIIHVNSKKELKSLVSYISETANEVINKFMPGPMTVILKKNKMLPDFVTSGLETIAIRIPGLQLTRNFIRECGVPIAAPSANISGKPSATNFIHVWDELNRLIPCILIGPSARHGIESTVVDCTEEIPMILRPGAITFEELRLIDPRIKYIKGSKLIKSPGQKYKHYAPDAKVILLEKGKLPSKSVGAGYIGLNQNAKKAKFRKFYICRNEKEYAKKLFSFFRECDSENIKTIYAEKVEETGIGLAIMNRLKKASG